MYKGEVNVAQEQLASFLQTLEAEHKLFHQAEYLNNLIILSDIF
jgi:hypothetical protein